MSDGLWWKLPIFGLGLVLCFILFGWGVSTFGNSPDERMEICLESGGSWVVSDYQDSDYSPQYECIVK